MSNERSPLELPDGTIDPKYVTASGHLSDEGWRIGLEWAGIPVVHADDYVESSHEVDLLGQTIHEDGRFNPSRTRS